MNVAVTLGVEGNKTISKTSHHRFFQRGPVNSAMLLEHCFELRFELETKFHDHSSKTSSSSYARPANHASRGDTMTGASRGNFKGQSHGTATQPHPADRCRRDRRDS